MADCLAEFQSRTVTCHGDFHHGNYLLKPDGKGMLAIDLEFSCVAAAINDLAYSWIWISGEGKGARRRIFLKAYLKAAGFPAESGDVEDLGSRINYLT